MLLTENRDAGRTGSGCIVINCLEQANFEQSRFIHMEKASKEEVPGLEIRNSGLQMWIQLILSARASYPYILKYTL